MSAIIVRFPTKARFDAVPDFYKNPFTPRDAWWKRMVRVLRRKAS